MNVNSAFDQCLPGKPVYIIYATAVSVFHDTKFRFLSSILFCSYDRDQALKYVSEHDNTAMYVSYINSFDV